MASTLKLGGTQYAVGLQWSAIHGGKKAITAHLKDQGVTHACVIGADGETLIGAVPANDYDRSFDGAVSLAGAVAKMGHSALVVLPIRIGPREMYWYVGINNGTVRPGTDVLMTKEDVLATVRSDYAIFQGDGVQMIVTGEIAPELSGYDIKVVVQSEFLSGLTDAPKVSAYVTSHTRTLIVVAAIVVIAGLGFAIIPSLFTKKVPLARHETSAEALARAHAVFVTTLHNTLNARIDHGPEWVDSARDAVYALPITYAGYTLTRAVCTPNGRCALSWSAARGASLDAFSARFDGLANHAIVFPFDGRSASFTMSFNVRPSPPHAAQWYDDIPIYKTFLLTLLRRFQHADGYWPQNGMSHDGQDPTPIAGLGSDPTTHKTYYIGTLHMTVSQLFLLDPLMHTVLASPYMSFNSLTINVSRTSPSMVLETSYVLQSTGA